jgi:cyclopropane-fatty-acyl-phospholipid synthase
MQHGAQKIETPRASPLHAIPPDPAAVRAARRVVRDLFGPTNEREFAVRYWDGTTEQPAGRRHPPFSLDIRHPAALRRMLLPPTELSIVEAYIRGDIDIGGDIERAASLGDIVMRRIGSVRRALSVLRHVLALPSSGRRKQTTPSTDARAARWMIRFGRQHTAPRDARAVRFHYDIGNDFYCLWLDRQMVYSCAYFARGYETLHEAQATKLEHVCRKLRLERGERLLDIGCGWGALAIHAARYHGAKVTGITLSEAQAAFARDRALREGVADRVKIQVRDYRSLSDDEQFDKIASVGMVEHVGRARLADYFAAAFRVLSPGGLFLNHGIVDLEAAKPRSRLDPLWRRIWQRDKFIRRYVFPDGRLVPAVDIIGSAESQGFELRDVESLREHYVETLRQWVRRLERSHAEAKALVGDATYRVWRLYMAASAHGFNTGRIGVIQTLLAKPDARGAVNLPRTRADLYST